MRISALLLLLVGVAHAQTFEALNTASDTTLWDAANPITAASINRDADTEYMIAIVGGDAGGYTPFTGVDWNTSETFTLVAQTTSSGSSGDSWVSAWCLKDPTDTTADVRATVSNGNTDSGFLLVWEWSGMDDDTCANVWSEATETVNDDATSTNALTSSGTSGNLGIVACSFFGADGDPVSDNASFTQETGYEGDTGGGGGAGTDQTWYTVHGTLAAGPTMTFSATDENACLMLEGVIASSGIPAAVAEYYYRQMNQ